MNRDDIIRMAEEASGGRQPDGWGVMLDHEQLERFAALVAAAEREECAKEIEQQWLLFKDLEAAHYRQTPEPFDPFRYHKDLSTIFFSRDMANAIRARGQG